MAGVNNMTKLFIEGAIEGFTDLVVPITAFSYAVNKDGAALNDTIRVPYVANASGSSTFTYAAGYTGVGNGVTGKDLTLNTLLYQPISLTDADFAQITPEVAARLGKQAGARLAADVLSASFAAVVTAGNFPQSCSYTTTQWTSALAPAEADFKANGAKWADGERYLIAGTSLWQNLMANTAVNATYAYGSPEVIKDGKLPSIMGFTPFKTTVTLPNTDSGFIVNPNAVLLGMAYHKPQGASATNGVYEQMTDEKTGITIGYREWYDPSKATTLRVLDCLFGVAKGADSALFHIKTTH